MMVDRHGHRDDRDHHLSCDDDNRSHHCHDFPYSCWGMTMVGTSQKEMTKKHIVWVLDVSHDQRRRIPTIRSRNGGVAAAWMRRMTTRPVM